MCKMFSDLFLLWAFETDQQVKHGGHYFAIDISAGFDSLLSVFSAEI